LTEVPLTIKDAALALREGRTTSVELMQAMLSRADVLDPQLGVNITRMDDTALAAAERADAAFAVGVDRGPLQGMPLGLKDILATDDAPTTAQSLTMDPVWSAQGDGPAVARLRAARAVIVSKNTTMEFANGLPDAEKPFPVPRNPWNPDYWTGGSSSGTGAGIAAGMFYGGLGTDTDGSIRFPAAYCGVTGLKQTYGRVPRSGCTQNGFSLDHVGPMARSAWDCAALLRVIAGPHATDPTSLDVPVDDYVGALTGTLTGLRIGVLREHHNRGVDGVPQATVDTFEGAVGVLEELGATCEDVVIESFQVFQTANWLNNMAEKAGIYTQRFAARREDWGRYTRTAGGTTGLFVSAADYVQTLRVRRYAQRVIADVLSTYDVLISATAKDCATRIDAIDYNRSGGFSFPIYTGVWDFVGLPAVALPMGFNDSRLPLSLQVVGRPFDEATVLRVGDAFQRLTDWHLRVPPLAAELKEEVSA
jgi:aspartyl-tRNA(Asn)/glutamyl-tRNA(Gln) amidotransferase subunit A